MRIHKVSTTLRFDIEVRDAFGALISGLVNGDFTKKVGKGGVSNALTVTVTEFAAADGRYSVTCVPDAVEYWSILVTHATYNVEGWKEEALVTTDGTVDTMAELAQAQPSATPSPSQAWMLLYMALRNAGKATSSERRILNDAGTVIAKAPMSDDGATFDQGKLVTGP